MMGALCREPLIREPHKGALQGFFKNKEACPSSGHFGGLFRGYLEENWRTFGGFGEEKRRKNT